MNVLAIGLLLSDLLFSTAQASPPSYAYAEIHIAARDGDIKKVSSLLAKDPSLVNKRMVISHFTFGSRDVEDTPLTQAASHGHLDVVKLLVSKGADLNLGLNEYPSAYPLHVAAKGGFPDVVQFLLEKGAKIDAAGNGQVDGMTALHLAAEANHKNVVEVLIAKGAKVDSLDKDLQTPLHYAAKMGNSEIAKFLISHGASVTAKNIFHQSPSELAAVLGSAKKTVSSPSRNEPATVDAESGYSGSNVDGGFARLRDNFPFNGGLLKGSFYRITAILEKKSGAGFNIENNSFALQNEFGKIEVVNRNWLSEFRNQTSTSYYTITTPLGVQELKQLLSSLNKYGVPPPAPFFKDYTPVQLKKSIAVKLSPSFPKSGRSGGIQQPISTVFTKTRSPFNSVGGKPTEFKDGAGKFSEIDSEGPHYVILSPDGEHKVLVDVRWLEPVLAVPRAMNRIKIGGILDLEDISYDSFPAQMDLIKEFITLYPTRDKFAWSNIQAAQISDDWKKCSSDYDCGAGLLNCVGWVPVNKTHTYGLRKSIEGDKNTCGKFAGPGPEPKIQCQKNICVAMAQLEHPESACTKDSDCVVVKYDCNQGTAVNAAHAEEMRAKICKCHDCVSNDCSEFNPHGIVPTCHDHSECAASFTGVGYYPLSGPDTRPDPIGEKWAKRFGGKSYPNCGK